MEGNRGITRGQMVKDNRHGETASTMDTRSSYQPHRPRTDDTPCEKRVGTTTAFNDDDDDDDDVDIKDDDDELSLRDGGTAVNTMARELVQVEQLLLAHMQSLKHRLTAVKRDDHRQRSGSLGRIGRPASPPWSSDAPAVESSSVNIATATTTATGNDDDRASTNRWATLPHDGVARSRTADTNVNDSERLRRRVAQMEHEEMSLRMQVNHLRYQLEARMKISTATRLRHSTPRTVPHPGTLRSAAATEVGRITASSGGTKMAALPEHLVRLNNVATELTTRLVAKSVANVMFDRGALSPDELDRVTRCPNEPTAAGVLLEIVLDEVERATFECFLDSLRTTDQHELYAWLVYSGFNSEAKEASALRCDDDFLLHNMDSVVSGLTYELLSAGLIDSRLRDELDAEKNSFYRNQRIVSLVRTSWKTAHEAERFMCALDRSGQRQVVDALRCTPKDESKSTEGMSRHAVTITDGMSCQAAGSMTAAVLRTELVERNEQHSTGNEQRAASELHRPVVQPQLIHQEVRNEPSPRQLAMPTSAVASSQKSVTCHGFPINQVAACVSGIAHLNNRIFVIADGKNRIKVMRDIPPYAPLDEILLDGLGRPTDIVGCRATLFLFVADYSGKCIWRVYVDSGEDGDDDDDEVQAVSAREWLRTEYRPWTLSTAAGRLVVTPVDGSSLYVYRCDGDENQPGQLIRSVRLPSYMVARHAVETLVGRDTFIVAHTGRGLWTMHDQVTEVNADGRVVRFYGSRRGDDKRKLDRPAYLVALGSAIGGVLVADHFNRRVVKLRDGLEFDGVVMSDVVQKRSNDEDGGTGDGDGEEGGGGRGRDEKSTGEGHFKPSRMCYVQHNGALLVGSWGLGVHVGGPVRKSQERPGLK